MKSPRESRFVLNEAEVSGKESSDESDKSETEEDRNFLDEKEVCESSQFPGHASILMQQKKEEFEKQQAPPSKEDNGQHEDGQTLSGEHFNALKVVVIKNVYLLLSVFMNLKTVSI
jgi:hypothetical protein